jgi:hypothetical protein
LPFAVLSFAREDMTMANRRRFFPVFLPLLVGLIAFTNVVTKPRFATYYKPDMVMLIGAGMCLGVAIMLLVASGRDARLR